MLARPSRFRPLILIPLALTFGCQMARLETRGGSAYGPQGAVKGGRASYALDKYPYAVQQRREDAYKQMFEYCGGHYTITEEFQEYGDTRTRYSGSPSVVAVQAPGAGPVAVVAATPVDPNDITQVILFDCATAAVDRAAVPASAPVADDAPAQEEDALEQADEDAL